jgi:hypothetical protein
MFYPFNSPRQLERPDRNDHRHCAKRRYQSNHSVIIPCSSLSVQYILIQLHATVRVSAIQGLHRCICTYMTFCASAQHRISHPSTRDCPSPRSSEHLIPYSVFVFCSSSTEVTSVDLLGSNAATSSIFLNCQGNREGYRNGRKSKPAKQYSAYYTCHDVRRQNNNVRLSSGLYPSCKAQHQTVRKGKVKKKKKEQHTAWYDGVRVVILCRFRAYSK